MFIAVFSRKTGNIKIFGDSRAACTWKKSGFRADTCFFHAGRHFKIFIFQAFMDTCHYFFPEIFMEVTCIFRDFFVVVITGPYCTGVIRGIAYEPQVIVILSCTCFSCNSHIVKLAGSTGTFFDNVFHGACKQVGSAVFDYRSGNGSILDQNISIMIKDLCIINRFDIIAVVCNCCVCGTEFYIFDTLGNTSEGSCQVSVTPYISVGIFICLSSMGQSSKSEIIQIFKTKSRGNLFQTFDCHNVDGILDCLTDGGLAAVASCGVVNRRTVRIFIWLIHKCSSQCITFFIQSRSVSGYNFKGRTRLSGCIRGTIQSQAGCFFTTASDQGFYITGMLVNNSHGRLRLRCKVYTLGNNGASVRKNAGFVLVYILLALFRRIEEKIEFRILITEIELQHFLAVIFLVSICILNGQCVIQFILYISRIVIRICIFFIKNLLNVGIQCCHDFQAATVKKISSLCFCVTFDIHKVADYLVGDLVLKIGVDGAFFFCVFKLCSLNTGVNIIIQGIVIFVLGNIILIQHVVQNFFPSFGVGFRVGDRIEFGWVLSDTCKGCTFRKIQIPYIFIEIFLGSCLYAVGTCSKVDGVQVIFKNYRFIVFLFNLYSQVLFLKLTGETFQLCGLIGPVCENVVLQKLLCDGTGTLGKITGGNCLHSGTRNTADINTVMFIKTFILNGYHCMLQTDRDLVQGDRKTVGCRG